MRKRLAIVVVIMVTIFLLIGCGATSSNSKKWTSDNLPSLKGKTMEAVISEYGQPTQKYSASNDNQVWEYRRESENTINTISKITTLGIISGKNNVYVDVLRIYFRDGTVVNTAMDENVMGMLTTGGTPIQPQQAAPIEEKAAVENKNIAEKNNVAPSPVKIEKVIVTKKSEPQEDIPDIIVTAQYKSFRSFPGKKTYDKLMAGIKSLSNMSVQKVDKAKGLITITVLQSKKRPLVITAKVSQGKTETKVELAMVIVDDFSYTPTAAAINFQEIFARCE